MRERSAIRLCLKHRDPAGFEFLVAQYKRNAYCHAFALLGNEADVADACQDAFVKAFAAMPRLKSLDRFYPWFYRILRNVCLNMLDRKKTRQAYAAEQSANTRANIDIHSLDAMAVALEEKQRVWQLLSKLPAEQREILTLKYIHGFRYDQIAETLDIPRGTVMSRLYAARKSFREKFENPPTSRHVLIEKKS